MKNDPDPIDLHVGRQLREMRVAHRMSLETLGKAVGVTYQQIQKYETGANRVSASMLWRLAKAFDVNIGWFFEGLSGTPAPDAMATRTAAALDQMAPRVRQEICSLIDALVNART